MVDITSCLLFLIWTRELHRKIQLRERS